MCDNAQLSVIIYSVFFLAPFREGSHDCIWLQLLNRLFKPNIIISCLGNHEGPYQNIVIQMLVESYTHTFYYRPFFNSPDCFCYRLFGLPANLYRTSAQYSRVSYSRENGLVITSNISWAYTLAICRPFIRFLHKIVREKWSIIW